MLDKEDPWQVFIIYQLKIRTLSYEWKASPSLTPVHRPVFDLFLGNRASLSCLCIKSDHISQIHLRFDLPLSTMTLSLLYGFSPIRVFKHNSKLYEEGIAQFHCMNRNPRVLSVWNKSRPRLCQKMSGPPISEKVSEIPATSLLSK